MNTLKPFVFVLFTVLLAYSGEMAAFGNSKVQNEKTKVYYFHTTRRCPTCLAIEEVTKNVLKEQPFSDAIENGDLEFKTFNAEETKNRKLVKELGISGSSLIVLKNGEKIDLTSKGFLYGLKQPEKLKQVLRETLND